MLCAKLLPDIEVVDTRSWASRGSLKVEQGTVKSLRIGKG